MRCADPRAGSDEDKRKGLSKHMEEPSKAEGNWARTALSDVGGFAFKKGAEELAPLVLKAVGLDKVADFLFPESEKIDYDRIALIVANSVNTALVAAEISEQNGHLASVTDALRMHYVRDDTREIERQLDKLTDIMGVTSRPQFGRSGIATYTLAANARLSALATLYANQPWADRKRAEDIVAVIDEALAHITPYMDSAIDDRLALIGPTSTDGNHHIFDSVENAYFGERFHEGAMCDCAARAIRRLIKTQEDWNIWGNPTPPFVSLHFGTSKWLLYVRDPGKGDYSGRGEGSSQFYNYMYNASYFAITGMHQGTPFGDHYVDSGKLCDSYAWASSDLCKRIQRDARAKHAWFEGFHTSWNALKRTLVVDPPTAVPADAPPKRVPSAIGEHLAGGIVVREKSPTEPGIVVLTVEARAQDRTLGGSREHRMAAYLDENKATWYDAMSRCRALDHGGFSDWQLPTETTWQLIFDNLIAPGLCPIDGLDLRYWTWDEGKPRVVSAAVCASENEGKLAFEPLYAQQNHAYWWAVRTY